MILLQDLLLSYQKSGVTVLYLSTKLVCIGVMTLLHIVCSACNLSIFISRLAKCIR